MFLQDLYLKQLYIKAKRRGLIELDLLIGGFADSELTKLSYAEIKLFNEFLDLDDELIYKCFLNKAIIPSKFANIFNKIKHNYRKSNETQTT